MSFSLNRAGGADDGWLMADDGKKSYGERQKHRHPPSVIRHL